MALTKHALRGHLEVLVLAALERSEAHGYEILKRLEARGEGALRLKEGSLYPALYRLDEDGHVRSRWEGDSDRRGPRRRIYRLTPKGRRRLAASRGEWRSFVRVIGRLMEAHA